MALNRMFQHSPCDWQHEPMIRLGNHSKCTYSTSEIQYNQDKAIKSSEGHLQSASSGLIPVYMDAKCTLGPMQRV